MPIVAITNLGAFAILPALAIVIALDWWIVHMVWTKVRQPTAPSAPVANAGAGCGLAAGAALVVLVLSVIGLSAVWPYARARNRQMETAFVDSRSMVAPAPSRYPDASESPPLPPAYVVVSPQGAGADMGNTAANADLAAVTEAQRQVLEAQLRSAQAELARLQQQVDNGLATNAQLNALKAEVEILRAEQTGDPVKIAETRLLWAQRKLQDQEQAYRSGVLPLEEYENTKGAVEAEQTALQAAIVKKAVTMEAEKQRAAAAALAANTPPSNRVRDDLRTRLQAVKMIVSWTSRDTALNTLAQDAAQADEPDVVMEALKVISSWQTKDTAARNAARTLARRGHREEAIEVAKLIASAQTRDATLSELSR